MCQTGLRKNPGLNTMLRRSEPQSRTKLGCEKILVCETVLHGICSPTVYSRFADDITVLSAGATCKYWKIQQDAIQVSVIISAQTYIQHPLGRLHSSFKLYTQSLSLPAFICFSKLEGHLSQCTFLGAYVRHLWAFIFLYNLRISCTWSMFIAAIFAIQEEEESGVMFVEPTALPFKC